MRCRTTASLLLLVVVLVVGRTNVAQSQPPLTLEQVFQLNRIGALDEAIAREIRNRGLDFVPTDNILETLRQRGAGPAMLSAISALVKPASGQRIVWRGSWYPERKTCALPPYPAQSIRLELTISKELVTGTLSGPGITTGTIRGTLQKSLLEATLDYNHRPPDGFITATVSGNRLYGSIREEPWPESCTWIGPFEVTTTDSIVETLRPGLGRESQTARTISPVSAPEPFLEFPLRGKNPYTVPVSAVFDHSVPCDDDGPRFYRNDNEDKLGAGKVTAYTGENGIQECGRVDCIAPNTPLRAYKNTEDRDFELANKQYTGGRWLFYEGHPGYDYPAAEVGKTYIYAPAPGVAFIPDADPITNRVSRNEAVVKYNILVIDHRNGYSTWYLHLGNAKTDEDFRVIECPGEGPMPLQKCRPEEFARQTCRKEVTTQCSIGRVGDKEAGFAHLHFEVRKGLDDYKCVLPTCFPVDPYGWGDLITPDPYPPGSNVRLWKSQPTKVAGTIQPTVQPTVLGEVWISPSKDLFVVPFVVYDGSKFTSAYVGWRTDEASSRQLVRSVLGDRQSFFLYQQGNLVGRFEGSRFVNLNDHGGPSLALTGKFTWLSGAAPDVDYRPENDIVALSRAIPQPFWFCSMKPSAEKVSALDRAVDEALTVGARNRRASQKKVGDAPKYVTRLYLDIDRDGQPEAYESAHWAGQPCAEMGAVTLATWVGSSWVAVRSAVSLAECPDVEWAGDARFYVLPVDIDGDGIAELLVREGAWESWHINLYRLEGGRLRKILKIGDYGS